MVVGVPEFREVWSVQNVADCCPNSVIQRLMTRASKQPYPLPKVFIGICVFICIIFATSIFAYILRTVLRATGERAHSQRHSLKFAHVEPRNHSAYSQDPISLPVLEDNSVERKEDWIDNTVHDAKCRLTVMFRTHDSERFIEEFVAFYISQGATLIHILDFSIHNGVENELEPYIAAGLVFLQKNSTPFEEYNETGMLHPIAMKHIRRVKSLQQLQPGGYDPNTIEWLLSVDDDEIAYPVTIPNPTATPKKHVPFEPSQPANGRLLDYLCMPEVYRFKLVTFRWRSVGTNGFDKIIYMPYRYNKESSLDIEMFTGMAAPRYGSRTNGKTAFQISHINVSTETWDYQGEDIPGTWNSRRNGGAFFLHGNLKRTYTKGLDLSEPNKTIAVSSSFGAFAVLDSTWTFHMSRSRSQLLARSMAWDSDKTKDLKIRQALDNKDINVVQCYALKKFADKVKYVIDTIGMRNFESFDRIIMDNLPFTSVPQNDGC